MKGRLSIFKVVSVLWILLAVSHLTLTAAEHDFRYRYENQTVKYRVLNEETKTCITCPGVLNPNETVTPANNIDGNLVIPEIVSDGHDEYTVVGIGECSFSNNYITHLELPNTVEEIGNYAFDRCSKLQTVILSGSLRVIGNYAFSWCSALQYINLPFSITEIGSGAFLSCYGLKQVIIPNKIENIRPYAFWNCVNLENVIIPNSVNFIEMEAFAQCKNLKSVFMPMSVAWVGDRAFMNCQNLTTLYYEDYPAIVGTGAFQNCNRLRKVEINSDFNLYPSSLNLWVGEFGSIGIYSNESGLLYYSIYSFTLSDQTPEEKIIIDGWASNNSELIVKGVFPGYSVIKFELYDFDKNLRSLGYCYVTVTDTPIPDKNKIEEIVPDPDSSSDVRYYDLNGKPINIDKFTGGIVIQQRGGKSEKIYIR